MARTLEQIAQELEKLTQSIPIAAATNKNVAAPSPAEVLQVQQFIRGLNAAAAGMAEDTAKAQVMVETAIATAAANGIQRSVVYAQTLSNADRVAYLEGQLMVIEACGCRDGAEEIRIRDNLRSLRGTK